MSKITCKTILLTFGQRLQPTKLQITDNPGTGKQRMVIYMLIHNLQSWIQRIYHNK